MRVFEILREKLEEKKQNHLHDEKVMQETGRNNLSSFCSAKARSLDGAIEIVNQVEQEYNNGWIPADNPPKDDKYILLSFENFSVPAVGRYEEDEEGGAYHLGDEDETCSSYELMVNAWQPLPEQYKD